LQEAIDYHNALPGGYQTLGNIAFAAADKEEYTKKAAAWDNFYSYAWGRAAQTVWVTPHSGGVNRLPDDVVPFPKLWSDNFTTRVATLCAINDKSRAKNRIMIYVHATGLMGAVLNPGDFGVLDDNKMDAAAAKTENKYHEKVQALADGFKRDYCLKSLNILERINKRRGTLDPKELSGVSRDDSFAVKQHANALKQHGQEITGFTINAFRKAFQRLGKVEVPVISNNYPYPARHVSELLKLREKIDRGLMGSALNLECAKYYNANAPELVADIVLDFKHELFPQ